MFKDAFSDRVGDAAYHPRPFVGVERFGDADDKFRGGGIRVAQFAAFDFAEVGEADTDPRCEAA
ncbi:hypothetical protein [Novipirellula herctigrandis]|uniref:hypothetical protein n=1 Tax=Novipirellula herctigrandis TaxID=2527986 RepID=UPI003AF3BFC5